MENIEINEDSRVPKYKQVIDSIIRNINNGNLKIGQKIPSINELSEEHLLSRDTVEKAYSTLKKRQIIESVKGKGYYISKTDLSIKTSVLFLINKLSTYKMKIFNSFVNTLGAGTNVDLDIYHCEPLLFESILNKKKHLYDYYVIMPHFKNEELQHMGCTDNILKAILSIPKGKLIIMDRNLDSLSKEAGRVYQNFTEDIFEALNSGAQKIKKYNKVVLAYPSKAVYPYPSGIVTGFKRFCIINDLNFEILDEIYEGMELQKDDLYITIEENDLVNLVKQIRDKNLILGKDVGIISYNDTPLKELLGITVVTTNFDRMGELAAQMILDNNFIEVKNEFNLINRNSV
ncbi:MULTISPECIES: winged helix-turn-helix domain-containing protein [Flavobacteriaceae]|uniref:GntR family transcriptional regulator n=1 Tax=Flavobacteriaceae TaxID=49546 RepID=UPI0010AE443A|nr:MULTISPECIES: winged helix-turn-helix domain-containing protein [Flavobacteriaceae]NJB35136.1 GntR family transcriptional regulator [Croceivirga sp. JEA036]TKD63560.1 GntR family transcriptional regulator [Flavobacterium sp. ASW18X]